MVYMVLYFGTSEVLVGNISWNKGIRRKISYHLLPLGVVRPLAPKTLGRKIAWNKGIERKTS